MTTIRCVQDDITTLRVDAIVNAANEMLAPGGGVCGAIHRAAGPKLEDACLDLPQVRPGVRCMPGHAVVTRAFDLPARAVMHAVGPVWVNGRSGEDDTLASCYQSCLELCRKGRIGSIAFPAISTGVYGFPPEYAAIIAVRTLTRAITPAEGQADPYPDLKTIILCAFDERTEALYRHHLAAAGHPQPANQDAGPRP
jgi:O-acetyl-ADP-ribose deacetylase (regulator of RNase III)